MAFHQHDIAGLDGDVGAGADGDAEIGLRERGRVVDAVADKGDALALSAAGAAPARPCPAAALRRTRRSMPICAAMASAVLRLSPVIITVAMPSARSRATAALASAFNVSAMAMMPISSPSRATAMTVCARASRSSISAMKLVAAQRPASCISRGLPTRTRHRRSVPAHALAGKACKVRRLGERQTFAPAPPARSACASGCSESPSTLAARRRTSSAVTPGRRHDLA